MGNRIKPNWGRDAGYGEMLPASSNELRSSVSSTFQFKGNELDEFLDGLVKIISVYRYEKDYRGISKGLTNQTKGKVKQAAVDIKEQTQILSKMLYGSAGGLQPYLDYSVSVPLRDNGTHIFLEEFTRLLQGIEDGCDHYLNDIHPELGKRKPIRLKVIMARDVRDFYRDFLGKEPTTTLAIEGEAISDYARLLKAVFSEADGFPPSDTDLKKIMSEAKNLYKD